jgi:1-acyl-sn-glycerol-3-phosphate acyltransferase
MSTPKVSDSGKPVRDEPVDTRHVVAGVSSASGSAARGAQSKPAPDDEVIVHRTFVYLLCHWSTYLYGRIWHRLRVEGLENLPKEGGAVLACNHQSFADILLLGGFVPRHVAFVARDTLANWRWLAYVMHQCGAVLVKRGSSDRRALRGMVDHLERGDTVAIFPEGTRTRDGSLQEFKGGALLAARMGKVPIVPLGIRGAFEAWPRGRFIPFPRKIALRFGAPIDSSLPDAQERVVESICAMVGDGRYRSVKKI